MNSPPREPCAFFRVVELRRGHEASCDVSHVGLYLGTRLPGSVSRHVMEIYWYYLWWAEILHHLRCTIFLQETCKLRIYQLIQDFFHQYQQFWPFDPPFNSQTWSLKWWIPGLVQRLLSFTPLECWEKTCPGRRKICWLLWKLKIVSVRTGNSYWWAGGACHVIDLDLVYIYIIVKCLN